MLRLPPSSNTHCPLCIVLLITTACKVSSINARELWLDETYSAFVTNLSFANMFVMPQETFILHSITFCSRYGWICRRCAGATKAVQCCGEFLRFRGDVIFAKRMLGVRLGAFTAAIFALSPTVFVYSSKCGCTC